MALDFRKNNSSCEGSKNSLACRSDNGMQYWWCDADEGEFEHSEEAYPSATSSTTVVTWSGT